MISFIANLVFAVLLLLMSTSVTGAVVMASTRFPIASASPRVSTRDVRVWLRSVKSDLGVLT